MTNLNNAADHGDHIETVDTVIVETTTPGPIGRTWNRVKRHPFKSAAATVAAVGAAGGASYLVYNKVRNGATAEEVAEAANRAAHAFRSIFS